MYRRDVSLAGHVNNAIAGHLDGPAAGAVVIDTSPTLARTSIYNRTLRKRDLHVQNIARGPHVRRRLDGQKRQSTTSIASLSVEACRQCPFLSSRIG
jgi:hypothetical protein